MTVEIHMSADVSQFEHKLNTIMHEQQTVLDLLHHILRKVAEIMGNLDALTAEVENNSAVDASAIALLNGLSAQLASIAHDPAAVQALSEELSASSSALAAAVTANTPAAVEPPVEPPVETPPVEVPPVETPPAA